MNKGSLAPVHAVLLLCLLVTLLPVILVFGASLRATGSLTGAFPGLSEMTVANYTRLLTQTNFLRWMTNTVIVSALASVVALFVTTLAGYAFSRSSSRPWRATPSRASASWGARTGCSSWSCCRCSRRP